MIYERRSTRLLLYNTRAISIEIWYVRERACLGGRIYRMS